MNIDEYRPDELIAALLTYSQNYDLPVLIAAKFADTTVSFAQGNNVVEIKDLFANLVLNAAVQMKLDPGQLLLDIQTQMRLDMNEAVDNAAKNMEITEGYAGPDGD